MLDDGHRRGREVVGHPVGRIEVEQVVERRRRPGELRGVGQRRAAMGRLAVEGGALVRVLAVAQVRDSLEDHRQALREDVAGDLVEVGGDLGVVGGHGAERLGGQPGTRLGGHVAVLAQLLEDRLVVRRVGDRGDPGRVAGGGAEERRTADVDHLDGLVDADEAGADLGRERRDVDDDDLDRADAVLGQLLELLGLVAAGEDAGVDGRMEGLDLAADEGRDVGQVTDSADLDALAGEVLAGPVGRVDLDPELDEAAREAADAVPIGYRQQRSHRASSLVATRGRCGATVRLRARAQEGRV